MTELWGRHDVAWRDPGQVISQWGERPSIDPATLRHRAYGEWWTTLAEARITLLVTREYEHLVMALGVGRGRPSVSYTPMPHPSGVAVDRHRRIVHVASTRNPNQVYDLVPVIGLRPRLDSSRTGLPGRPLIPVRSRFLPGSLYIHDLAMVGGRLHANAVGENAVIRLEEDASHRRVWWPRCIETADGPVFGRNHLQLNSIAARRTIRDSFYSASTDRISRRRPGHRNFPVDRRGVIFSGRTREPIVRGLTRPHSARWDGGRVWVANSGYGELGVCDGDRFVPLVRLRGWTRGLCFRGPIAFVGTSRVIPRFRTYAPGLDVQRSVCGVHAVDTVSGRVLGGLVWPAGNQVFGIDWISRDFATGFPFSPSAPRSRAVRDLFYAFDVDR